LGRSGGFMHLVSAVAEKVFWTTKEFAAWINRSTITLQRWRSEGTGPAYVKVGGRVMYERETIYEWLRGLEVNPAEFEANETPPEKSDDGYRRYSMQQGGFVKGGAS
jgi:hypothetical protein